MNCKICYKITKKYHSNLFVQNLELDACRGFSKAYKKDKYRKSSNNRRPQKIVAPDFSRFLILYRSMPMRPIFNFRPFLKLLDQGL